LADFGLSKRIDEASKTKSKLLGMVPYIDPKVLMDDNLKSNEKSDIYSIGVLLWEISSGIPPFREENYDFSLMYKISQGRRETIIPNTPNDYANLYTGNYYFHTYYIFINDNFLLNRSYFFFLECWNGEPNNRPSIHNVVDRLRQFISYSKNMTNYQQNENLTLIQMIQDFDNMNTNRTNNKDNLINLSDKNLSNEVKEITDLILKEANEGKDWYITKQHVLDYLSNHNISFKEINNWLLNNQNNSDSIFMLGYFSHAGIETKQNFKKAFNLFINASEQDHVLAQFFIEEIYEYGTKIAKNEKLAFEYSEKIANKGYAISQYKLGWLYQNGIGVKKDFKIAAYWYKKAANNGHLIAMHNLGLLYENGNGVEKR
jgi:hypothetical protein